MARTPLFRRLRTALALARGANRSPMPAPEYLEQARMERALARRNFLVLSASLSALGVFPGAGCAPKYPEAHGGPRVAIIGAGVAGLTAAYRLGQGGVSARVFDSWNRVGGRMFTARNRWADGQLAELGGELIDTGHHALRRLAAELGLTLDPILEPPASGVQQDTWSFGGRRLSELELVEMFRPVSIRLARDAANEEQPAEFARLDQLGLGAYLDSIPELDPLLRSLIEVAYVGEYGREIAEQSPWNLLWLIDSESRSEFRIYGDSDEAFHVHGGNDQVTTLLAARLPRPVTLDQRLVRVVEKADGAFRLTFARGAASSIEEDFDHVCFALPFTRLRQVEIKANLPATKREIIATLGMGTNAKLMGQFSERIWRTQHRASGSVTTDNGLQLIWETSRGQAGGSGILTVFAGGRLGEEIGKGDAESQLLSRLPKLDTIFPGTAAKYLNGSAARMHWPAVEHTLGSYTCYLPGQARFSGQEGQRVGNLHFCGEHTSVDHQGYMNGAVESGERVATELLADLGIKPRRLPSTALAQPHQPGRPR